MAEQRCIRRDYTIREQNHQLDFLANLDEKRKRATLAGSEMPDSFARVALEIRKPKPLREEEESRGLRDGSQTKRVCNRGSPPSITYPEIRWEEDDTSIRRESRIPFLIPTAIRAIQSGGGGLVVDIPSTGKSRRCSGGRRCPAVQEDRSRSPRRTARCTPAAMTAQRHAPGAFRAICGGK